MSQIWWGNKEIVWMGYDNQAQKGGKYYKHGKKRLCSVDGCDNPVQKGGNIVRF